MMYELQLQRLQELSLEEKEGKDGRFSSDGSEAAISFDSIAPSNIRRKIDFALLPYLFILYVFCFIDRSNIAIARLEGLEIDLHLSSAQYNGSIAIFYFFYFLVEVPANIILFHTTARVWFTFLAVAWGVLMMLQGFSKNWTALMLCRAFQGLAEGGLFPGVAFYFSTWYPKYQSGFRLAIFFSSVPFAGAINGFIAHAIDLMDGVADLRGWAWLFILEGLITIVFGATCFYFISDGPASAKFLNEKERVSLIKELHNNYPNTFKWTYVNQAFCEWKIYVNMLQSIIVWTSLYSISLFLPRISREFGHGTDISQLITVPVYALAFVLTLSGSFFADRYRQRGIFMLGFELIAIIGFLILRASDDHRVRYVGCFFAAGGSFPLIPLLSAWNSNNLAGSTKRAIGIAMQVGFGNLGGIIAPYIYDKGAPCFMLGHTVQICMVFSLFMMTAFMTSWFRRENLRRAYLLTQGDFTPSMLRAEEYLKGDKALNFVHTT